MPRICFPEYYDDDILYVTSFGIERKGEDARWGPGRRQIGIVHYVLSGEGIFNGHIVTANQGFYIEPGLLCEYYPNPENPWNYVWIDCSPELAQKYVYPSVKPDEYGIFSYDFQVKLMKLFDRIHAEGAHISRVKALNYALSVISLHAPEKIVSGSQHYIQKAKNFIESSLNRRLTVCDVAKAISIHDRYLYALFVQYEGMPPKEYILKRKVETAADLLENTDLSVSEVAVAVGFPDVYGFSRFFKQKMLQSPSEYRKTLSSK